VTVLKVEPHPKLGAIVHVRIEGVWIRSPRAPDGVSRVMGHMPYAEGALARSVVAMVSSSGEVPSFDEGYNIWKKAFDQDKAGVWTMPLAECIAAMEQAMNQQKLSDFFRESPLAGVDLDLTRDHSPNRDDTSLAVECGTPPVDALARE
jgi:hypothetical protein